MSTQLSKAIYTKVTGVVNPFNTAIGGRFYPDGDKKEETSVKPYTTYMIFAQVQDDVFRAKIDNVRIQFKNVSDDSSKQQADDNNKLLLDLLDDAKLTVAGNIGVQLFRENQIPAMKSEDKLDWISTTDFRTKMQKE